MTIHYEPNRQGMTVLPPEIDEATGEVIQGSEQVVDTRVANWDHSELENDYQLDEDDDALEDQAPSEEIRLAETFQEINTTKYDVNPEFANEIASVDIGDTPEAITVQHLVSQVFAGELLPEEAFQTAINSGLNTDKLMFAYYQLQNQFKS